MLLALGLLLLGLLPGLWGWALGWVVLGFGMAMGLYEAAFATLGVLYGRAARRPITLVTLVAGFASTVGWPMSAALVPLLGWRGTCLAYAAMLLLRGAAAVPAAAPGRRPGRGRCPAPRRRPPTRRCLPPGCGAASCCWRSSSPCARSSARRCRCT